MSTPCDSAVHDLASCLASYLREIEEQRVLCARHEATTAIHRDNGKVLEIYRQYKRDGGVARSLRESAGHLPGWERMMEWQKEGEHWRKLQGEIEARMHRHQKQHPILTRGVAWEGRAIMIHAYKFEPDPRMKVELVLPKYERCVPELPLTRLTSALRLHEFLVPDFIAMLCSPSDRHEVQFLTLSEYLSRAMPEGLAASLAFRRARGG